MNEREQAELATQLIKDLLKAAAKGGGLMSDVLEEELGVYFRLSEKEW